MESKQVVLLMQAKRLARSGEALRLRTAAGLSLQDMAQAVGCAPSTLWRWEKGLRMPRRDAAVCWAELLNEISKNLPGAA